MAQTVNGHGAATPKPEDEHPERQLWDARGFYRNALAVVAPIPMAAIGFVYLLTDIPVEGDFEEIVDAVAAADPSRLRASEWLVAVFLGLLIPAVIAVAAVTWRRVPRTTAGAVVLTVPAFGAAAGVLPNDNMLATLTNDLGLDVSTIAKLNDAWNALPVALLGGLAFIVGIVFGLGMLGVALWRSRQAPAWMGIALALGAATHPFLPGHIAQGVGLLAAAVGFSGASIALFRMSNEDFAPMPASPTK